MKDYRKVNVEMIKNGIRKKEKMNANENRREED